MIASGTRLGSYRVEALIGQGGMGQVYRATDTRLDRTVAIKILPSHLASQPQLRERFEREARAISTLSHPHVCTLFDVGRHDGVDYLVMEYVEGESLADRLARGSLPPDQVIRYGREIAQALAAAHRHGIVHRDLKPGNVMITKSGAKLLDFGLAKTGGSAVIAPDAATEQHKPLTEEGTLLGTFQYMAPEQVEGREADARTDIFALGALLYEMVTGKRAFEGKSKASLIASILDREPPPITAIDDTAPRALDRLIRACLAKEPDDRVQSARDVALELSWIAEGAADSRTRRVGWKWWLAAAAVIAAGFVAAALLSRREPAPARAMHLALLPPPGFEFENAAMSHDGRIAFVARKGAEHYLFVRDLADAQPRQLQRVFGMGHPFWSPDGKWIAYFGGRKLFKTPAAGGAATAICDSNYGVGGTWTESGDIIFTPGYREPLHVVASAGGKSRPLTRLDPSRRELVHAWPTLLPDGGGILYLAVTLPGEVSTIVHVPTGGGKTTDVIAADALVGYSAPYLLYVRSGDMFAVPFDAESVRVTGEPRSIVKRVAYRAGWNSAWSSVTRDGILLFPPRVSEKRRLVWYDRAGRAMSTALEDLDIIAPRLSPDGKQILLSKFLEETGEYGIYRVDTTRGTRTLLTPPPRFGYNAVWLDAHRFVFTTASGGSAELGLFIQEDDPQARPVPLWVPGADDNIAMALSPDGSSLLAHQFLPDTYYDLWLVPLRGNAAPTPVLATAANEYGADFSPDGRWIVYGSNATGAHEVYVRPLAGGRSVQVSTSGGFTPRWSRDGREIFFVSADRTLMSARVDVGMDRVNVDLPKPLFRFDTTAGLAWELGTDGNSFLVNELADDASAVRPYHVVTGWQRELGQ